MNTTWNKSKVIGTPMEKTVTPDMSMFVYVDKILDKVRKWSILVGVNKYYDKFSKDEIKKLKILFLAWIGKS